MRRKMTGCALVLAASLLLFCGCDQREDTREHIRTIGVVFTNELTSVFDELYVYPGDTDEMGPDFIKNTKNLTRVGSFGITVAESEFYDILIRDRDGGVYSFEAVEFANADQGIITFEEAAGAGEEDVLTLTIYHRGGGVTAVAGGYVTPGDAPDHPHNQNTTTVAYQFDFENATGYTVSRITMMEAGDPDKGEVELYIRTLDAGGTASVGGRLDESDTEISEWLLHVEMDGAGSVTFETPFNPWETDGIRFFEENDSLEFLAAPAE